MSTVRAADPGGFFAYLATPFDAGGDVDLDTLARYTEQIVSAGVDGITCVASTCEGPYLTEPERRAVVETVARACAGRVRLNVGVGAFATRQVIEHAAHARAAGATSLMIEMQQYFPIPPARIAEHYRRIAAAVDLPIRLYNLPVPTRVDLEPEAIRDLSDIDAIGSVKDASGDVERLRRIRELCGGRFTRYCGLHFQLLDGMRLGAQGWEVMLHPLIAAPLVALYRELRADPFGERGAEAFARWQPLFGFFRRHGVPQSIKAIAARTDLGLGAMRPPQADLDEAECETVWRLACEALG
ncbi:MAG: dihydrodipicolinate synthase family protein [Lautropia sp.]